MKNKSDRHLSKHQSNSPQITAAKTLWSCFFFSGFQHSIPAKFRLVSACPCDPLRTPGVSTKSSWHHCGSVRFCHSQHHTRFVLLYSNRVKPNYYVSSCTLFVLLSLWNFLNTNSMNLPAMYSLPNTAITSGVTRVMCLVTCYVIILHSACRAE